MDSYVTQLSSFTRWLLVSSMQVSVLICLILTIKAAVRGRLAVRWHYWLWLLLLARMLMPWAPESNFSIYNFVSETKKAIVAKPITKVTPTPSTVYVAPKVPRDATSTLSPPQQQPVKPVGITSQSTSLSADASPLSFGVVEILSLLWLIVASALAVFALACNFRLWRIIKSQRPLTEGRILELLEDCKAQMDIQTVLGVVVTDRVKSPALFGVIRPRLLLPVGMLKTLSQEELRYVFLHELAHLKRHDIYLGWLMVILQLLHWFNPLVWLAFARMRADRELACDGLVLSTMAPDESLPYGQTLVNIFKGFSQIQFVPGIAGILENKSQLKRRITMIARFKKGSYQWSVLAIVLLAVLGFVTLTDANPASESVPPGAEDTSAKKTLQSLVDAAKPGGTVVIPKGVYTKPIDITKSLKLKGESRADCVFEVTANKPAIFVDTRGKGRVTIEEVTVKWQLATSDKNIEYPFAIGVKDTKAEIKNCNFVPLGDFKRSPVAVRAMGFSEVDVNACRFEGFGFAVFYNEGTKGAIRDSMIANCQSQGITIFSGATVDIVRNIITGSKKHAVRNTGGTLRMRDNLIIANANRGVYLGNKSASGVITNNIIMNNGTGISGFARSKVTIENNIIADSSYAGIGFRNSCGFQIRNNIFKGNQRGWIMFKEGNRNNNGCQRNTFWENEVDAENFQRTGNSVLADPGFADPENGDFSLKPGPALEHKQGLTNPEVLKTLWKRWKNPAAAQPPKTESHTKPGSSGPRIVSTIPEALANDVSPELDKITVTFDEEMMDSSWSWTGGGDTYPERMGQIHYDQTKTTCTMPVKLEPGKVYWVGINSPSYKNFKTPDRRAADWYIILFTTKGADGSATTIPADMLERAKSINKRAKKSAPRATSKVPEQTSGRERSLGERIELSYDDGSGESKKSIAGSGHAVIFDAPSQGCVLKSVRIFGSRYGHPQAPKEDFHIWLCDENFNVIKDFPLPYSRFKRGNPRWVTLRLKSVEVPSTFLICAGFNPGRTKGVYVHYDESSSGNSFTGLPGKEMPVFSDGEWMIRAVVQQPGSEPKPSSEKSANVILRDSFENGTNAPTGWKKDKNVNGVKYIWDKNNASDGKASLCLKKTANRFFPIAQWTRKIQHKTNASAIKVSAQVKAENATKAILDALFLDENGKWIKHEWVSYIGQKQEENIPPANHNWKTYSGTVEIPENTKSIVIALQIYGPGNVWLDELEVAYVN